MLKLNEDPICTVLALWMLLTILVYNVQLYLLTIAAITISEIVLLVVDQIKNYSDKYAAFVQQEKENENES